MAALETAQDSAKAVIMKAEETIKELEQAVQAIPKKPEERANAAMARAEQTMRELGDTLRLIREKPDDRARIVMTKAEETIRELEDVVQPEFQEGGTGVSPWLLGAALGSIAFAVTLYARKKKDDAMFVGLWAPTFLALGLFKDVLSLRKKT